MQYQKKYFVLTEAIKYFSASISYLVFDATNFDCS